MQALSRLRLNKPEFRSAAMRFSRWLINPSSAICWSLCRYLANPADTIAAISLLRGPWCGVTLNTLNQLLNAHPERPLDLLHALQHLPSVADDEGRRLQRVLAVLQWAEVKRDRLALSIWVEQIWLRLGGALVARGHDLWRVEMFLSLLRKAETSGLGLSIEWLDREIKSATLESPDTDSRATIMTLHKAKGLEFDYVFVPHLQKARSITPTRIDSLALARTYRESTPAYRR